MWIPKGGPKGALIVNGRTLRGTPNTDREMFVNYDMGNGPWTAVPCPIQWQGGLNFDGWRTFLDLSEDGHLDGYA